MEIINHLKNTTTMGDISPVDILPAIVFPAQPNIAKQSNRMPFLEIEGCDEVNTEQLSLVKR